MTDRSVQPEQYGRFLIDVFEDWVRRDVGEVYVQMFDVALANWVASRRGLCVHAETCGLALALEHTGDLYSCDHFVEPRYRLGNIREQHMLDLVALAAAAQVRPGQARHAAPLLPRLRRALRLPRRLPQGPVHSTPDGEPGLHYSCPASRPSSATSAGDGQMGELLRAGARAGHGRYARADARRGRNDPCTCGSGRKWKVCHGASTQRAPVSPR